MFESAHGGMPRQPGVWMYVMLSVDVWFCDHSEWWGVWLLDSTLGGGFDLWGGWGYSHTCVYVEFL
jgi:hypothetical protein